MAQGFFSENGVRFEFQLSLKINTIIEQSKCTGQIESGASFVDFVVKEKS